LWDLYVIIFQAGLEGIYLAMVVKMVVDNATIDISKENYELFCDVKTFLHFMLPLL
jgi:hypothetical protein